MTKEKHHKKEHKVEHKKEHKVEHKKSAPELIEDVLKKHSYALAKPDVVVDEKTGLEVNKKRIEVTGYGGTVRAILNRQIEYPDFLGGSTEDGKKVVEKGIVQDLVEVLGNQIRVEYQKKKITINGAETPKIVGLLIVSNIDH